jgi:hypothetical protein
MCAGNTDRCPSDVSVTGNVTVRDDMWCQLGAAQPMNNLEVLQRKLRDSAETAVDEGEETPN